MDEIRQRAPGQGVAVHDPEHPSGQHGAIQGASRGDSGKVYPRSDSRLIVPLQLQHPSGLQHGFPQPAQAEQLAGPTTGASSGFRMEQPEVVATEVRGFQRQDQILLARAVAGMQQQLGRDALQGFRRHGQGDGRSPEVQAPAWWQHLPEAGEQAFQRWPTLHLAARGWGRVQTAGRLLHPSGGFADQAAGGVGQQAVRGFAEGQNGVCAEPAAIFVAAGPECSGGLQG